MFQTFYKPVFFSFLFCLTLSSFNSAAQGIGFDKVLRENGDRIMPFCVKNTQLHKENLEEQGVRIKRITKNWIFFSCTPAWINEQKESGVIESFYFERPSGRLMNDSTRAQYHVNEVHQGLGGLPQGYTGKGVIVGVVDNGIDYRHPDFKDTNDRTRVLRYWDHTKFNGPDIPTGYAYGQEWDSTDINDATITSVDNQGHGSTVAGAAAGNGRANGSNMGMAPDADIVAVHTDFNLGNWTLTIADACEYIFSIANEYDRPCVINLSIGTYLGSHDGTDPASEYMEALLDEKRGRIIVGAAGNSGAWGKYHVEGHASPDTSFTWMLNNPSNQLAPNSIYGDVWLDSADAHTMSFGFGADSPTYSLRGQTALKLMSDNISTTYYDTIYNSNGDKIASIQAFRGYEGPNCHMEFLILVDSTSYKYRFMTAGQGQWDIWSGLTLSLNEFEDDLPTTNEMPKIVDYQAPDTLKTIVSSWNCSEKVISVGNVRNRAGHINYNGDQYTPSPADFKHVGELSRNSSKAY